MDPTPEAEMKATVAASPRNATYGEMVDRESAYELLAAKLEKGAEQDAAEKSEPVKKAKEPKKAEKSTTEKAGGVVKDVVQSSAFKQFMRTAAAEVARGLFGTARRR